MQIRPSLIDIIYVTTFSTLKKLMMLMVIDDY